MSLTLQDLRVRESDPVFAVTRPVSLADLVEVLKQEGAVEYPNAVALAQIVEGRYLVLPLGDTP